MNHQKLNLGIAIVFIALFWYLKGLPERTKLARARKNVWDAQIVDSIGTIENGLKEGKWEFRDRRNRLVRIEHYRQDTLNGEALLYDSNGDLEIQRFFYKGIVVDTSKVFSGGELNYIDYYDSTGPGQGEFKIFNNGIPTQIGHLKDNKFHGENRTFHFNGALKTVEQYEYGEKVGTWYSFSENGDTTEVIQY